MNLQLYGCRPPILTLMSVLLILSASAYKQANAQVSAESDAERYVLDQLQRGEKAEFPQTLLPQDQQQLRADFLKALFTNSDPKVKFPRGIEISYAVIVGELDLSGSEIPHNIKLFKVVFSGPVQFSATNFTRNFEARGCRFQEANFSGIKVGGTLDVRESVFDNQTTTFAGARIGGAFVADDCEFQSEDVDFSEMRVDGVFATRSSSFIAADRSDTAFRTVIFEGTRAGDFYLNGSTFKGFLIISFKRLRADTVSFSEVVVPGSFINSSQMSFKRFSPVNFREFKWLLRAFEDEYYVHSEKSYGADFYNGVETALRTHGFQAEADDVFIERKRAERRYKCGKFGGQCESLPKYFASLFHDIFTGYGKRLQNLLYWGALFVVIGTIVFRREEGMKVKKKEEAPDRVGKYHPFWYSLDLFLPIIKLGEADVWTPQDNRRWANLYKKVHTIVGALFVPIGLAAWTGIIK